MGSELYPRLDRVPNVHDYIESGDTVEVLNQSGHKVKATFRKVLPVQVQDYETPWSDEHDNLYELWTDPEIKRHEQVVEASIGNDEYAYPISRVRFPRISVVDGIGDVAAERLAESGYKNIVDLVKADEEELTEVEDIGPHTAKRIKEDVGDARTGENSTCPVDGCLGTPDEDGLYDHMIQEHGWYMEDLEVQKV